MVVEPGRSLNCKYHVTTPSFIRLVRAEARFSRYSHLLALF